MQKKTHYIYSHLIYIKDDYVIQCEKGSSIINSESIGYAYRKIFNLHKYLTTYAKVNSRKTITLNVIDKAIKTSA